MKKDKPTILIAVFALLGIAAGIIRYLHKTKGFDSLELAVRGNVYNIMLTGLVVSVLLLIVITLIYMKKTELFTGSQCLGTIGRTSLLFAFLSSLAMGAGAVIKFALSMPFDGWQTLWGVVTGALMFSAAAVQIGVIKKLSLRNCGHRVNGNTALIAVFMSCFVLIEFYRGVSTNPSPSFYVYNLFSHISLILMLFACAGYIHRRASLLRMFVTLISLLFFGTMTFVSELFYTIHTASKRGFFLRDLLSGSVLETVMMLYGLFFAVSVLILFFRPKRAAIMEE